MTTPDGLGCSTAGVVAEGVSGAPSTVFRWGYSSERLSTPSLLTGATPAAALATWAAERARASLLAGATGSGFAVGGGANSTALQLE